MFFEISTGLDGLAFAVFSFLGVEIAELLFGVLTLVTAAIDFGLLNFEMLAGMVFTDCTDFADGMNVFTFDESCLWLDAIVGVVFDVIILFLAADG